MLVSCKCIICSVTLLKCFTIKKLQAPSASHKNTINKHKHNVRKCKVKVNEKVVKNKDKWSGIMKNKRNLHRVIRRVIRISSDKDKNRQMEIRSTEKFYLKQD